MFCVLELSTWSHIEKKAKCRQFSEKQKANKTNVAGLLVVLDERRYFFTHGPVVNKLRERVYLSLPSDSKVRCPHSLVAGGTTGFSPGPQWRYPGGYSWQKVTGCKKEPG